MGYPKDLDEYDEADLLKEMQRRARLRAEGLCDYCERPRSTDQPCRFLYRHAVETPEPTNPDGWTEGDLREIVATMRNLNREFYSMVFRAGMGSRCHAFVEFCGLQAKFIDMCQEAMAAGISFPSANTHSGTEWPIDLHHAAYLGEKFNCIFGFALARNPKLAERFFSVAMGEKPSRR